MNGVGGAQTPEVGDNQLEQTGHLGGPTGVAVDDGRRAFRRDDLLDGTRRHQETSDRGVDGVAGGDAAERPFSSSVRSVRSYLPRHRCCNQTRRGRAAPLRDPSPEWPT